MAVDGEPFAQTVAGEDTKCLLAMFFWDFILSWAMIRDLPREGAGAEAVLTGHISA